MTASRVTLIVLAKSPIPGRVKTRLCPPCTLAEAAALAEAALVDTLEAVRATSGVCPLLVLDGPGGDWIPWDVPTVPQRGRGLDERITAAFDDAGGPALLVGMDTPHVTAAELTEAVDLLMTEAVDSVLGPSRDGGFWALGLRDPAPAMTLGIPMSSDCTGWMQHQRLIEHGQRVGILPELRDVDTIADARVVARRAPTTRFASVMNKFGFAPFTLTAT